MDKLTLSSDAETANPDYVINDIGAKVDHLVSQLVERLRFRTPPRSNLLEFLRWAVIMAKQDRPESLLISGSSLALGALAACIRALPSSQNPSRNSAVWTGRWLRSRFDLDQIIRISDQMIDASVGAATDFSRIKHLNVDSDAQRIFDTAGRMSGETRGSTPFELRHLLLAIIASPFWSDVIKNILGASRWDDSTTSDFAAYFVNMIMENPRRGETRERWMSALASIGPTRSRSPETSDQRSAPTEEQAPAEEPSQIDPDQLMPFNNDLAIPGDDLLDTGADVRALSRLAALKGAAPLAMAIFGGWGAGKSTFMARMEREIDAICAKNEPAFVGKVVHIRFNAWQFADANIWASLTAEFFDQMRAGGHRRQGNAQLAQLVTRVNAHVHALSTELETAEDALASGRNEIKQALENRTKVQSSLPTVSSAVGAQAVQEASALIEAHQHQLEQLTIGKDSDLKMTLKALHEAASSMNSGIGWLGATWALFSRNQWRFWWAFCWGLLFVAALVALLVSGVPGWNDRISQISALVAGAVCAWQSAKPAITVARALARSSTAILEAGEEGARARAAAMIEAEQKLQRAIRNAEIQEATLGEVRGRLARYVDPDGQRVGNPPRLLRYVLEDDPDCRSLESEIGLIGRARRLFLTVDEIIRRNADPEEKQPDPDLPERIVIYIDDLDRCSFDQVYAVLQAVHLLLAFESFVVVVGVDPAWVQGTLTHAVVRASGATLDSEVTPEHRHKAALYLDKIFQVALWLNPLDSQGDGGGTFGSFVRAMCVPREPDEPATPGGGVLAAEASPSGGDQQASAPAVEGEPVPGTAATAAPLSPASTAGPAAAESGAKAAPTTETDAKAAAAFMRLDDREIAFLASDTIARICEPTPRTAKRMVNSYRLLRSRLAETGRPVLKEGTYQALAIAVAVGICSRPGTVEALQWRLKSIEVKDLGDALGAEQLTLVERRAKATEQLTSDEQRAKATVQDKLYLERMRQIAITDTALIKELNAVPIADFSAFLALALRHACSLEAAAPAPYPAANPSIPESSVRT